LPPTLEPLLRGQRLFSGLEPAYLAALAGCAANAAFPAGEFLFREGEPAGAFFLISAGSVALEIAVPGRGGHVIQTLGAGDVAGFSWLIEPHRWEFDGRAVQPTEAVQIDGACLRAECDADPRLGYQLMRRFATLATTRLQATRLQLLDVYGHAHDH
jgi:CRP-like cAMP-binding protein